MPLHIQPRPEPRFPDDFEAVQSPQGAALTPEESEFISALEGRAIGTTPIRGGLNKVAAWHEEDSTPPDSALKRALGETLAKSVVAMRDIADRVAGGRRLVLLGAWDFHVEQGKCFARREQLSTAPFIVRQVVDKDKLVTDVEICANLSPPEAASAERQDLFVKVCSTSSIVRLVCDRWDEDARRKLANEVARRAKAKVGAGGGLWNPAAPNAQLNPPAANQAGPTAQPNPPAVNQTAPNPEPNPPVLNADAASATPSPARRVKHEYLSNLASFAQMGLQGNQAGFAAKAIDWIQADFAGLSAPRIKNSHLASLARWCGPGSAVFLLCYLWAGNTAVYLGKDYRLITVIFDSEFVVGHKAFFLLFSGASVGVWLSFSLRNITIPFNNLTTPEDDLLTAPFRLFFVLGLTALSALLFWTGALNIEIGALKMLKFSGGAAFLIGGFFGVSERALSDSFLKRANTFVTRVGGG